MEKLQALKEKYKVIKEQKLWPESFGTDYGNLFRSGTKHQLKYHELLQRGYTVCQGGLMDAEILKTFIATATAGDNNKKQGSYPRNFAAKQYIFDNQNTSKSSHSKRWVKKLNKGFYDESRKKHPAAEGGILYLKKMLASQVDLNKNEIQVYGPCELGSDAIDKNEDHYTVLQLWHRDDQHGIGRYVCVVSF